MEYNWAHPGDWGNSHQPTSWEQHGPGGGEGSQLLSNPKTGPLVPRLALGLDLIPEGLPVDLTLSISIGIGVDSAGCVGGNPKNTRQHELDLNEQPCLEEQQLVSSLDARSHKTSHQAQLGEVGTPSPSRMGPGSESQSHLEAALWHAEGEGTEGTLPGPVKANPPSGDNLMVVEEHVTDSLSGPASAPGSAASKSGCKRYEKQKQRDWNLFHGFLSTLEPPVPLANIHSRHVIGFFLSLEQFGKTKVHSADCCYFATPERRPNCMCPLKQAWGTLDSLAGRLRAAFRDSLGEEVAAVRNPFSSSLVKEYIKRAKEEQEKARGIKYRKGMGSQDHKRKGTGDGEGGESWEGSETLSGRKVRRKVPGMLTEHASNVKEEALTVNDALRSPSHHSGLLSTEPSTSGRSQPQAWTPTHAPEASGTHMVQGSIGLASPGRSWGGFPPANVQESSAVTLWNPSVELQQFQGVRVEEEELTRFGFRWSGTKGEVVDDPEPTSLQPRDHQTTMRSPQTESTENSLFRPRNETAEATSQQLFLEAVGKHLLQLCSQPM